MATSNASRTCLRKTAASCTSRVCSRQSRAIPTTQRNLHTPAPLHLDFLAPSWHAPRLHPVTSPKTRSTPAVPRMQKRSFSGTESRHATAVTNPRKDDDGNEMTINITPRAAHRLQTIAETDDNPGLVLRVSVESGGCHGFQYLMSLVNTSTIDSSEDTLFENEEVARRSGNYKAKVVMDEPSLELLKGSSIDYTMELIGSQFKVTGIPGAKSSCGCGTSFDIAA